MSKDKLKNFIKVNKPEFEQDLNEDELWIAIESKIKKKSLSPRINWFAAASVLLLLAVGWLSYDRLIMVDKIAQLENIQVEGNSLQQIESYYSQTISNKSKQLKERSENRKNFFTNLKKKFEHKSEIKEQIVGRNCKREDERDSKTEYRTRKAKK